MLLGPLFLLDHPSTGTIGLRSQSSIFHGDVFSTSYLLFHSACTTFMYVVTVWPILYLSYMVIFSKKQRIKIEYSIVNNSKTQWGLFFLFAGVAYSGMMLIIKEELHRLAEPVWDSIFENYSLPVVCCVGGTMMHILIYSMLSIFALVIQNVADFQELKIQQNKKPASFRDWMYIMKEVLASMLFWQGPFLYGQYGFVEMVSLPLEYKKIGSVEWYLFFCFAAAVIEDVWHFMAHRTCHVNKWLYKNVHKLHHTYTSPFGPVAEQAHVVETLFLGLGFFPFRLHVGPLFHDDALAVVQTSFDA